MSDQKRPILSLKLEELEGEDITLVVVALQALHRERANAYNSACTACELAGKAVPQIDVFGLDEINVALRRIGATSMR